ncbi:MAG: T9SS type A sorting domain-containing protein, partial [Muribaculaceae bacterium]|nr:T9SS type A sorting domain-containing protein [Muribaculaceae bacterium]
GIVGANYGTVSNSVAINGKVSGNYDYAARFGGNDNARNISSDNHSWDLIANGSSADWTAHGDHAELHSVGALADFSTFKSMTNWDFDNVWEWVDTTNARYPVLRGLENQSCVHPTAFTTILTSVEEMIASERIRVSVGPNPFDGYITVSASEGLASAELYSMGGSRAAYAEAAANDSAITLTADGLTAGVYVLRVSTVSGQVYSFKVSKK